MCFFFFFLQFMQRGAAAQKPEKSKKGEDRENETEKEKIEKTNQDSPFGDSSVPSRKWCVVLFASSQICSCTYSQYKPIPV